MFNWVIETPGVSVSARVLINTFASRRDREMEWLQMWVWVQRRGRRFPMWTFSPLPCAFVHTPMNADPACKNHLLAVDIHHAIWLPSTFLVLFLGLKISRFMVPLRQEGARTSFSQVPLQLIETWAHPPQMHWGKTSIRRRACRVRKFAEWKNSDEGERRHLVCRGRGWDGPSSSSPAVLKQQCLSWSSN